MGTDIALNGADLIDSLAEGYDADLIIVDGDPLADITILADPAHITRVWKAGRRVKGPSSDLTGPD